MVIDGISQSTGVERVVEVKTAGDGVLLVIRDRVGTNDPVQVVAPADQLMAVLTDHPDGPRAIENVTVEVRRNEVLLTAGGSDAAVGLDDLMDAVAAALSS
jgi:hypothetical protein